MDLILVSKCTNEELMEYQFRERHRRSVTKSVGNGHDIPLLESNDDLFILNNLYLLYYEGIVCGFAATPSYLDNNLIRIYVEPEYQRLGVGRFTLDFLGIESLNCFVTNNRAMKFYQAIGFTYTPFMTPSLVIFKRKFRNDRPNLHSSGHTPEHQG